ncbi:MAG: polysaccharide deacetylase 2 family uncharacterized protein YibQ [Sulfurimonas sp.]|jgi:polysaccharide deacetylase 2 family uncharacterized protein YibQ
MAKRKKTKSNNSSFLTYIAWALAIIAIGLSSLVGGYYIGYEDAKNDINKINKVNNNKRLTKLQKLEEASSKKVKKSVNTRLKDVLKKETKVEIGAAAHEYENGDLPEPPEPAKRAINRISSKPKLAIIIDDVSVRSQVSNIKSLGIPLTMSFLPPSKSRPNSAKLAAKENFYMVHLPMEAQNFSAEEPNTLRITDSDAKITAKIREIKKEFPRVAYINNHTGSKFTSNELSMNRLLYAMKDQHINFIDSRTTAKTKAPIVMKNMGLNYVARDVFLDHASDKASIKIQIKRAIKIAKLHGTAIAIGHPHTSTLLAIAESKKLFKDVELVYINELY